ncbi:MAG TPA: kynureninase [Gemmataceae bacterium]|jgi:kynureninase|nr:kynureninase [Gemmataceae bacterium]
MGLTAGNPYPQTFQREESFALRLDTADPLAEHRNSFFLPELSAGQEAIYFCSHSLGLQPRTVTRLMEQELKNWALLGVEGHFKGATPWYTYQDLLSEPAARLVGAEPGEVIHMNGLTINLHLMMETFYRPSGNRFRILMDEPTFPSDLYALQSQLQRHGIDPADGLLTLGPRSGEHTLRHEDVEMLLEKCGQEIALVLWSGVSFLTGQRFDMQRITTAAKRQGCVVGFDLAHAAGNVPLLLHDWNIDFAVWCTYKYLNSGPGSVAGCFVHEQHGSRIDLPRLAGWWGNDPYTRFRMQLEPHFRAQPGVAGWQVSNPPILALLPLRASFALYDEAGLAALRAKSTCLTSYLYYLLDQQAGSHYEIITPRDPEARGCQLSILVRDRPRELMAALTEQGVSGDFREPNIIRVAPVPFYNTFHEVWRFAQIWSKLTR